MLRRRYRFSVLIRVEMGEGRKDRHAVLSSAAGAAASVVAAVPVAGLAVPRARPIAAHDDAATRRACGRPPNSAAGSAATHWHRSPRISWRATSTCA